MTGAGTTDGEGPDAPDACARCGREADDAAAVLTWTLDHHDHGYEWVCPACSRDHVQDIEARLDLEDWA